MRNLQMWGAVEQGDEADEAFGGTVVRMASAARPEVPPHARAGSDGRGHRFAAYRRCSAGVWTNAGYNESDAQRTDGSRTLRHGLDEQRT